MKRETSSVGQWYKNEDTQELFQVIDWDDCSTAAPPAIDSTRSLH